jgi:hypothetical protein
MRSYKGFSTYFEGHIILSLIEKVVDKLDSISKLEVSVSVDMKQKLLSKIRLYMMNTITYKHNRKKLFFQSFNF